MRVVMMVDGVDHGVLRGKRILIVEDETLITMLFEDILGDLDCEIVGPALNLRQALDLARTAEIDAAVVDLNLGGEQSFPAAEILRDRGVPVVLSSGYGATSLPAEWQHMPTLPKPFTADQVVDVLSAAMAP